MQTQARYITYNSARIQDMDIRVVKTNNRYDILTP